MHQEWTPGARSGTRRPRTAHLGFTRVRLLRRLGSCPPSITWILTGAGETMTMMFPMGWLHQVTVRIHEVWHFLSY